MLRDYIKVVEGDLLDQEVDVIVHAWNRNVIPWWLLLPQEEPTTTLSWTEISVCSKMNCSRC
jgi:hypothetical protein